MENMLQAVVVVFMLFLCALCLFAVIVIVRDIIYENAKTRRERDKQDEPTTPAEPIQVVVQPAPTVIMPAPVVAPVEPEPEKEPAPVAIEEPVEEVEEVEDVAVTQAEEIDPDAVIFSRVSLTMEEKYAALSKEHKRFFDDIVRHALAKEGVKESKRTGFYDYKIGAYRVIRMTIKRSEIVCEFNFIDKDFAEYASGTDVKMKRSATSVRVLEVSAVGVAKDGIDLVCNQIAEDKERKKELAREKRREKRRQSKEDGSAE